MIEPTRRSRILPLAISYLGAVLLILALSHPARAATVTVFDDFETDAAMFESWRHSPFVLMPPDVHLDGLLYYTPGVFGRGLVFAEGSSVDAYAFLDYQLIPAGATATSGSVEFLLSAVQETGSIELWGSENGTDWMMLGEAVAGFGVTPFSLSIAAGDPAQFLSLRGRGTVLMDDLNISVSYIPLPASAVLMACGLGALAALRRRS